MAVLSSPVAFARPQAMASIQVDVETPKTVCSLFRSDAGQSALEASGNGGFMVVGMPDVGTRQRAGESAGIFNVTVA